MLSIRQVEVSRTLVFDNPRRARAFFQALVTELSAENRAGGYRWELWLMNAGLNSGSRM
jgi:hypothetical protein